MPLTRRWAVRVLLILPGALMAVTVVVIDRDASVRTWHRTVGKSPLGVGTFAQAACESSAGAEKA